MTVSSPPPFLLLVLARPYIRYVKMSCVRLQGIKKDAEDLFLIVSEPELRAKFEFWLTLKRFGSLPAILEWLGEKAEERFTLLAFWDSSSLFLGAKPLLSAETQWKELNFQSVLTGLLWGQMRVIEGIKRGLSSCE